MKKAILIAMAVSLTSLTMAQSKAPVQAKPEQTVYRPAPDKKFNVEFTASEFEFLISCSQYGFQPYVRTTPTPMNQVDNLAHSFQQLLQDKIMQYKKQYSADSIKLAVKPK